MGSQRSALAAHRQCGRRAVQQCSTTATRQHGNTATRQHGNRATRQSELLRSLASISVALRPVGIAGRGSIPNRIVVGSRGRSTTRRLGCRSSIRHRRTSTVGNVRGTRSIGIVRGVSTIGISISISISRTSGIGIGIGTSHAVRIRIRIVSRILSTHRRLHRHSHRRHMLERSTIENNRDERTNQNTCSDSVQRKVAEQGTESNSRVHGKQRRENKRHNRTDSATQNQERRKLRRTANTHVARRIAHVARLVVGVAHPSILASTSVTELRGAAGCSAEQSRTRDGAIPDAQRSNSGRATEQFGPPNGAIPEAQRSNSACSTAPRPSQPTNRYQPNRVPAKPCTAQSAGSPSSQHAARTRGYVHRPVPQPRAGFLSRERSRWAHPSR